MQEPNTQDAPQGAEPGAGAFDAAAATDLARECDRLRAEVGNLSMQLEDARARSTAAQRSWREQVRSAESAQAAVARALDVAVEGERRAQEQQAEAEDALTAVSQRLDGYRDFYERVVTVHARWSGDDGPASHAQVRTWLADLPELLRPRSETDGRLALDLHEALVTVDELRGLSEQLQELWLASGPGLRPQTPDGLAAWVGRRLTDSTASPNAAPPGVDVRRVAPEVEAELRALREHRDAVLADHLAVMSSQSWRVGHVMTWPVRVFRRKGGPRPVRSTDVETYP